MRLVLFFIYTFIAQWSIGQDSLAIGLEQKIEELCDSMPSEVQFSIAVIRPDSTYYFGWQKNKSSWSIIENRDSLFEIGSVTKVFTSQLLAQYVLAGQVNLEDKIHSFLPFDLSAGFDPSFVSLSNHTSGLARLPINFWVSSFMDAYDPYRNYSEKLLAEHFQGNVEQYKAEIKYEYSNFGAGLLGYTLSQVAKKPLSELIKENIYLKCRMTDSYFQPQEDPKHLLKGKTQEGNIAPNWHFDVLAGAGAALSTTNDMAKYLRYHLDARNSDAQLMQKETHKTEALSLGLGWIIVPSKNSEPIYLHDGGTGGFTSFVAINPTTQNGIVVLANYSANGPHSGAINQIGIEFLDKTE